MNHKPLSQLRIAVCGSASTGKTSLANALAREIGLPCLREEMRDYLENGGIDLTTLPAAEVGQILKKLWRTRIEKEQQNPAFIADNSSLDFAAYALYYGCLDEENARTLLEETCAHIATYDAILVLPWGAIPYVVDGVRPANCYLQLRYQLLVEGLLHHHADRGKIHFLPKHIVQLNNRLQWGTSVIHSSLKTSHANCSKFLIPDKWELTCKRILVARARPGASVIAARLREMNAEVIETPSISVQPLNDWSNLDRHLLGLSRYDAIVFGCSSGVRYTVQRLENLGVTESFQAIAVGSQAHQALRKAGVTPAFTIPGSCHQAISECSALFHGKQLLLITSEKGRPNLRKELINVSATVDTATAYRSFANFGPLPFPLSEINLVVLPGSSAARLLLTHPDSAALKDVPMIAMGEMTEIAASQCGATRIIRSPHDDIEAIIHCILSETSKPQDAVSNTSLIRP
jgi:uroporphyrinogen-III synthase/nicotinamide riboside kinase